MKRPLFLALMLLGMISAIIRHLPLRLDYNDQAKQAYVSYEMIHAGKWLFQHSPDREMATKPPLYGWLSAACYVLTRSWTAAWYLPALLAGLLLLAVVYRAAQPLGNEWAMLAAGMFMLNHLTQRLLFMVRTDMLLALITFIPVSMIYTKRCIRKPWMLRDDFWFGSLLWMGLMIKGPVNYAFILPGLLFWRLLRRKHAVGSQSPSVAVFIYPLLLFGLWVLACVMLEPEFYRQVVLIEFGSRFKIQATHSLELWKTIWYYPAMLLGRVFPWSLLLVLFPMIPAVRSRIRKDPALLWLVCACAGGLLIMSLIPSKRPDRIFPLIPMLSLLCAAFAAASPPEHVLTRLLKRMVFPLLWLLLAAHFAYSAQTMMKAYRRNDGALVTFGSQARQFVDRHNLTLAIHKSVAFNTGMVLYAGETNVLNSVEAIEAWTMDRLGALIINSEHLPELRTQLPESKAILFSENRHGTESVHVLLVKADFCQIALP